MSVALHVEQTFDVELPKDVEQAQRCGTGPKRWNRPKEVEQRKDQQYFSVLLKKMGVALDVEQAFDVEQSKDVEQPKDVEQAQRCGTGPKRWNRGKISNTFQCFKKNGCRPRCGTSL